jgi:hypothetical protein
VFNLFFNSGNGHRRPRTRPGRSARPRQHLASVSLPSLTKRHRRKARCRRTCGPAVRRRARHLQLTSDVLDTHGLLTRFYAWHTPAQCTSSRPEVTRRSPTGTVLSVGSSPASRLAPRRRPRSFTKDLTGRNEEEIKGVSIGSQFA